MSVVATTAHCRFDFGSGPVTDGFLGVGPNDRYDEETGYGFHTPENIDSAAASADGAATDAVRFVTAGRKSANTFDVDLPAGLYRITVTLGDTVRSSIVAQGVYQIMNMTGNAATASFLVPITDGQLRLLVTEGEAGTAFTLSALEVTKLSGDPTTHQTIHIGGDSTVSNYYPLSTSHQAGWGQMLPEFVNPDTFTVRNLASGGQTARGFRDDGQLESVLKYIKPGDYFLLQLGINDTAAKNNTTEAEFKDIMRDMVTQIQATGAVVVLLTAQGSATDFYHEGVHASLDRWYRHSVVALAQEEAVPLVDLNVLSSAYFTSIGPKSTLDLYLTDDIVHPNRAGATALARLVAADLGRQGLRGFDDAVPHFSAQLDPPG